MFAHVIRVLLFILLYILDGSNLESKRVTTQMKVIEQYVHVALFIMLHKLVLADSLSLWMKPLVRDLSNEGIEQ